MSNKSGKKNKTAMRRGRKIKRKKEEKGWENTRERTDGRWNRKRGIKKERKKRVIREDDRKRIRNIKIDGKNKENEKIESIEETINK